METKSLFNLKPHIRGVFGFQTSSRGWYTAFKCGVAVGLPVLIAMALGDPNLGFLAFTGTFASQYGFGAAGRLRVRLMVGAGILLLIATLAGMVTAGNGALTILALASTAFVSTLTATTFRIGPPAAFYMVMAVGITNRLFSDQIPPDRLLIAVSLGVVIGIGMGLSDLIFDRHGVERRTVERAEEAVGHFSTHTDAATAAQVQAETANAVNDAWTQLTDAGWAAHDDDREVDTPELNSLGDRLLVLHKGYLSTAAAWSAGQGEDGRITVLPRRHTRETSLGRPSMGQMISGALDWPSEPLLIAIRNGLGVTMAGLIASTIGTDRIYWAAAFTVLMLHTGGTRVGQTYRSIQRMVGTILGIGLYIGLAMWNPAGVWLALVLGLCQAVTTYLLPRNYALAVAPITAMTMLIVAHATGIAPDNTLSATLIEERLVDNAISVISAIVIVWTTFTHSSVMFLRSYSRRVVEAIEQVLDDLALGREDTRRARRDRQALYITLLEAKQVADRAIADDAHKRDPDKIGASSYDAMVQELLAFGYHVLGLCWTPGSVNQAQYVAAGDALSAITNKNVRREREPGALEAEIKAAHQMLTEPANPKSEE